MLHFAVVLTMLASCHAWNLQTNHQEISLGSSKDVYLLCLKGMSSGNDRIVIERLLTIRITKLNAFGSKLSFASVYASTNDTSQSDDDVILTSNINRIEEAFLKVTWPIASKNTAGIYGCEIDGYDTEDSFVNLQVTPVVIKEKMLTENDVRRLMQEMTLPFYKNYHSLKLELENFKKSLTKELADLKLKNQDEFIIITTNIDKIKQDLASKFITKDELKDEMLNIKNVTVEEIMSDNLNNEKVHRNIYDIIESIEQSYLKNFTSFSAVHKKLNNSISKKIVLLEKKANDKDSQTKIQLETLSKALQDMDSKFENITDSLAIELDNDHCPCLQIVPSTKEPETTNPTPTQTVSQKWPDGVYTLVQASGECPGITLSDGRKQFTMAPVEDYIQPADKDDDIRQFRADVQPRLRIKASTSANLSYCRKSVDVTSGSAAWPKGSYCITREGRNCPEDFHLEILSYQIKIDGHIHFFNTRFCCRSDASARIPMLLPTSKPFYLIRYGNECQRVSGMNTKEHMQCLSSTSRRAEVTYMFHPHRNHDNDKSDQPFRHLCHYEAS